MKAYVTHIIFCILGLILFSLPVNGFANSGSTDEMVYMLMNQVNNARADIRQALKAQGKSIDSLLKCRPQIQGYIDLGFPRVIPDSRLFAAASSHAADMADQLYFSKTSKNGLTIDDRFLEAGFDSGSSDEILGVVLFQNYMSKEKAVDILWEGILDNELDCRKQPVSILFNPDFREIGVSVKFGSMIKNNTKVNFYVAVCDFGSDRVSSDEKELFLLMNKARAIPEVLSRYLDPETPYDKKELPPYKFNTQLYRAAKQLIDERMRDILHNNNNESESEPLLITDRLFNLGYQALSAAEVARVWITVDRKPPEAAVNYLLKKLLAYEAGLPNPSERILLNSGYLDAGMALVIQPMVSEGETYFVHAISMVAAVPAVSGSNNTLVCSGMLEGGSKQDLQGILLQVEGKDGIWNCFTDRTHAFSVELPPGYYTITSPGKESLVPITRFILKDRNIYIPIDIRKDDIQ